jgi:1-acyl-sn-glycerol-3-phosphate acyltransferase
MRPVVPPETDASRVATWARRAITIPGLVVFAIVDLALLPVLLLGALVSDLARRRRLAAVRFHLAVAFALWIHVIGLALLLRGWIVGLSLGGAREQQLDVRSEVWWATAIWRAAVRLYGMHVEVEGAGDVDHGPVVVMSRHASLLDILLPIVFVSAPHRLALRYVAKRELLWDPCIDLLGHRLATAFVRRGARAHDAEIALVEALARDLGPRDGVVIFPEGTRFTPEKRARTLARLAEEDRAAFEYAARLAYVLPPHPGGPLGLLDRARDADVVFCAHTGLEGAGHLEDLLAGSLVDTHVHVAWFRVPAREVPEGRDARLAWLRAWWKRIDEWIAAHHAREAAPQRKSGAVTSATAPRSLTST